MGYRVAVVGATGNVGREILNILVEREFPVDEVFAVKSPSGATGITTFYDNSGDAIDLMWPAGGVIPTVTTGAGKSDIYSFRTFDGGSSFYGVVGGQNFG